MSSCSARTCRPGSAISEYVDDRPQLLSEDEPGLVNAVLDALAREVRGNELGERRAARSGR